MKERIRINGRDIDLGSTAITLSLKSNILKRVSDISACYSYTYQAPLTLTNRSIFGELLTIGASGKRVRQYLPAEYYRDDRLIFNGKCYVVSANNTSANLAFVFGIFNALQKIKEDNLLINQLFNGGDDRVSYYYTGQEINDYKINFPLTSETQCAQVPFTYTKPTEVFMQNIVSTGSTTWNNEYAKPAVSVKGITDLITKRYGIGINLSVNPGTLWVLTPNKRRKDFFSYSLNGIKNVSRGPGRGAYGYGMVPSNWQSLPGTSIEALSSDDIGDRVEKDVNVIGQTVSETVRPFVRVKSRYKVLEVRIVASGFSVNTGKIMYVPSLRYDSASGTMEARSMAYWTSTSDSIDVRFKPEEFSINNTFESGDGVTFVVEAEGYQSCTISNLSIDVYCQMDGEESEKGYFNSIDCLPDVSVLDFLNDCAFGANCAFPVNQLKGEETLVFKTLDSIAQSTPVDWSEKLISSDVVVSYRSDGMKQKNLFSYAQGDKESADSITVSTEDGTLEKEGEWFASQFGKYYAPNYYVLGAEWAKLKPSAKIVSIDPTKAYRYGTASDYHDYVVLKNANMEWLIDGSGDASGDILRATFRKSTVLECKMMITANDLAVLDFSRPVYLRQFGAIFFVEEMTVGGKDEAKVKLMEIKR